MIKMEKEKLLITNYDEAWAIKYEAESSKLKSLLHEKGLVRIHHIGSTAIPEMDAKPIIDICIEIKTYPVSNQVISLLNDFGYEDQGECGVPGRHWFTKGSPREFHLHITPENGEVCLKHLKFRDTLRSSGELRQEYKQIKLKFQGHEELDSHEYNLHKAPFVERVLKES